MISCALGFFYKIKVIVIQQQVASVFSSVIGHRDDEEVVFVDDTCKTLSAYQVASADISSSLRCPIVGGIVVFDQRDEKEREKSNTRIASIITIDDLLRWEKKRKEVSK